MPRKERSRTHFERIVKAGELTKASREKLRHKQRADIPGTRTLTREPALTDVAAQEFVKLLHSGIPPAQALAYFAPDHYAALNESDRRAWLSRWVNARPVMQAAVRLNGDEWQNLDHDARLKLALDKAMSEMAYYLMSNAYSDCILPADRDKWTGAREAIADYLKANEGDEDSPMLKALRDIIEGKMGTGPPVLQMEQTKALPKPKES